MAVVFPKIGPTANLRHLARGADDRFVVATVAVIYTFWGITTTLSNPPESRGKLKPVQLTLRAPSHPANFEQGPPFHAHDAFYTLSTCGFSTGCHSFAGNCACAHIIALNLRIHVNRFVRSLYLRPPPPPNLIEGDFTFVTLSFNNAMRFLKGGPHSDATREIPTLCFYNRGPPSDA